MRVSFVIGEMKRGMSVEMIIDHGGQKVNILLDGRAGNIGQNLTVEDARRLDRDM
jgi:hypothetical protein